MQYKCQNCGNTSLRWEGRCDMCGEWGTYEEFETMGSRGGSKAVKRKASVGKSVDDIVVKRITEEGDDNSSAQRISSGVSEFDRVLGGGFVKGEVVLLTGQPGVGKSTLLMQVVDQTAKSMRSLYVSGEESVSQLRNRFDRIGKGGDFSVTSDTELSSIVALIESGNYDFVVVDSIQAIFSNESSSFPGSVSQVRVCGYGLMEAAKKSGVIIVIVGQINKEGVVAGPKVLEHLVDCVLHMEGDKDGYFKVLRAGKNRFGSTYEIGVFQMTSEGILGVENPSKIFLPDASAVSGSVIGATVEGSRVVLLEVQALVVEHGGSAGPLKRVANGVKRQRLDMLCAVLSRRGGVFLGDKDVYVNVSGGVDVSSPSLDLAICSAIKSAVEDNIVPADVIYIGEVGLTGEVKAFYGIDSIIENAKRLGYATVVSPVAKKKAGLIVKKVSRVSHL